MGIATRKNLNAVKKRGGKTVNPVFIATKFVPHKAQTDIAIKKCDKLIYIAK